MARLIIQVAQEANYTWKKMINTHDEAAQNVMAVVEQTHQVGESKNNRINALAAANTAWAAMRAAESVGSALSSAQALANGDIKNANVSVSLTYGEQKNVQTQHIQGNTATNSAINAGGNVTITATGADNASDINIVGSDVSGKQGTRFLADDEINFLAAKQTHQERSNNKSSGWNAGVSASYGSDGFAFGVTAGGNDGKGYGNGDETTWRTSHIGDKASNTVMVSGGNTTVQGAQVLGKNIISDVENLTIASVQDTMSYSGKQKSISGQATVGYGASVSASFNQSKMNADYASVQEQSGLFAGDEGYQVNVRKHTDLTGGLITSTAQAEADGKNSFSTGTLSHSDIENYTNYKGSAFGVSGSVAMNFDTPLGKYGQAQSNKQAVNEQGEKLYINSQGNSTTASRDSAGNANKPKLAEGLDSLTGDVSFGFGYDKESQASVTKSGINTTTLHIRDEQAQLAKTGKSVEETLKGIKTEITAEFAERYSGKLGQNFDKEKVQNELDLQRDVTQKFDQNRQEIKERLYAIGDKQREEATQIRKTNGGYDTEHSIQLDREATDLDEKIRWLDMGLGILQGSAGDTKTMLGIVAGTQADRAVRSATAPKEMWYQKCSSSNGDCSDKANRRQIWSLNDLTAEEQANLRTNENLLTISNPGIFNDRNDSLKNAQKQNTSETNQKGIVVVMNRPTGRYDGGWIVTSLVSELMYAAYDKVNDKYLKAALPLNNSQKLNQDLYRQAEQAGYQIDTSNHSRGGLTASIALQDMNIWKGETNIPIRKSRFYGTATNVEAYSNQLQRNGYSYTAKDGKTYQSGAYSAVHQADPVGNKWGLGLLGSNEVTGGNCWICYSHSSYFAEVPDLILNRDLYQDFKHTWGEFDGTNNTSQPKLVLPTKVKDGDLYEKNAY